MKIVTALLALPIAASQLATQAYAAGDAAAGQALFEAKCALCHSAVKGENKLGPSLWAVIGRPAGSLPDFTYSDAMKNANRVWNADTLDVYLTNPRKAIPGVRMLFAGYPDKPDRDNVIAYLTTLK